MYMSKIPCTETNEVVSKLNVPSPHNPGSWSVDLFRYAPVAMKNILKRSVYAPDEEDHSDYELSMPDIGGNRVGVGVNESIWGSLGRWNVHRTYNPWLTDMNHAAILHTMII